MANEVGKTKYTWWDVHSSTKIDHFYYLITCVNLSVIYNFLEILIKVTELQFARLLYVSIHSMHSNCPATYIPTVHGGIGISREQEESYNKNNLAIDEALKGRIIQIHAKNCTI